MAMIVRLLLVLLVFPVWGYAQSFSQYSFAPLLLNPAGAGATSDLSLAANYRNQRLSELTIQRTAASLMSPVRWGGQKRLGVGIHFLSDRAEELSRFSVQEIGSTLAYHHRLVGTHYLSVGGQATYRQARLGLGEVTTGSQWMGHRGFDPQTAINESFGNQQQSTYYWSAGGLWYQERKPGQLHHYVGMAAQQLNRPALHWLDNPTRSTVRYTAQAGWQAFRKNSLSATPEALWWREDGQQYLNLGAKLSYHFSERKKKPPRQLSPRQSALSLRPLRKRSSLPSLRTNPGPRLRIRMQSERNLPRVACPPCSLPNGSGRSPLPLTKPN